MACKPCMLARQWQPCYVWNRACYLAWFSTSTVLAWPAWQLVCNDSNTWPKWQLLATVYLYGEVLHCVETKFRISLACNSLDAGKLDWRLCNLLVLDDIMYSLDDRSMLWPPDGQSGMYNYIMFICLTDKHSSITGLYAARWSCGLLSLSYHLTCPASVYCLISSEL